MNNSEILSHIDHTVLSANATKEDIRACLSEATTYGCAAICVPPSHVRFAAEWLAENDLSLPICTVVAFPLGYQTTTMKVIESSGLVNDGADEIDVVINIGWLKEGRLEEIRQELYAIRTATKGKVLKVIIETCLLTDEEKITMCEIVSEVGADYIKTSTGFSRSGADLRDIELFRQHLSPQIKIKAAGGIRTREQMVAFLKAGCDRLGSSSGVALLTAQDHGDKTK